MIFNFLWVFATSCVSCSSWRFIFIFAFHTFVYISNYAFSQRHLVFVAYQMAGTATLPEVCLQAQGFQVLSKYVSSCHPGKKTQQFSSIHQRSNVIRSHLNSWKITSSTQRNTQRQKKKCNTQSCKNHVIRPIYLATGKPAPGHPERLPASRW